MNGFEFKPYKGVGFVIEPSRDGTDTYSARITSKDGVMLCGWQFLSDFFVAKNKVLDMINSGRLKA